MKFGLVSRDAALFAECRDLVLRLPFPHCDLILIHPGTESAAPEVAVRLWDLDTVPQPPELEPGCANVFLARRDKLRALLDRDGFTGACILLKPLNRAALQTFVEQAVRYSDGVHSEKAPEGEISCRDALLRCLLHASLRLQEYDEDRTSFWARAAHDLRAPLIAAAGYCDLLLEGRVGPVTSEQRELLQRIRYSLRRLTRMASSMHQLSISGRVERAPELKQADMEECIRHSLDEILPMAAEKQIEVSTDLCSPGSPLYFEPSQMEQTLENILENACKFAPRGGSIEIRAYPVAWKASSAEAWADEVRPGTSGNPAMGYRVDVRDSGPGIRPEHLESIFDAFTSYGGPGVQRGGGLGLAICKMIVTAHRGEVWAESVPGATTISFVIPLGLPISQEGLEPAVTNSAIGAV